MLHTLDMKSKYSLFLHELSKKPFFRVSEARLMGLSSRMVAYFCQMGFLERISRGLYRGTHYESDIDAAWEDLVMTVNSIPKGVVCLISALCYYELTDQMMREYWIAIPNSNKKPLRPHTRILRMRNMTLGQIQVQIGNFAMKIFDRERTVVDAFRFLSHEIAIKALQAYLRASEKADIGKLSQYSKILKVNLSPYLMALTT